MSNGRITELVVLDQAEPCPYLPNQLARMPLRTIPAGSGRRMTDLYLGLGFRRAGEFVYQTECPDCRACEAIRIPVRSFRWTQGFRRTLRRGDRRYRQQFGPVVVTPDRVALFNRHRLERGLARGESEIDAEDYHWGFARSCFDSFEIAWFLDSRLVSVSICDRGARALSAVYTFYDPSVRGDSLGTYAILRQVLLCEEQGIDFLYLGYYVADCPNMNYKVRFLSHDRLIGGRWRRFHGDGVTEDAAEHPETDESGLRQ